MRYHHGQTIKEHRIAKKMTLAQLASKWPSKEIGVNIRYVQDVEAGNKQITNMETLRKLASLLDIPLWKLGLSEYNPFDEKDISKRLVPLSLSQTLSLFFESAEILIEDVWRVRLTEPLFVTEKIVSRLVKRFQYMISTCPPAFRENKDFLRLYAQVQRLQAVLYVEKRQYQLALQKYYEMLETAKLLDDPVTLTLAHSRIGVELLRSQKIQEGILYLEAGRDYTFRTSKNLAAVANAFLARAYASSGDVARFERTIDTAINLGTYLGNDDIDTTDFVFHSQSGILEEKSNGYILLKNPQKTLLVLPDIEKQIMLENSHYLKMWLPLDWAQAMLLAKEVEESVREAREFFVRSCVHKSPHVLSHTFRHVRQLEQAGYGNVQDVREFREQLEEHVRRSKEDLIIATQ